jgi:hypothetical protein
VKFILVLYAALALVSMMFPTYFRYPSLFGKLGMRDQLRKGRRLVRNLASLLGASGSASIGEAAAL